MFSRNVWKLVTIHLEEGEVNQNLKSSAFQRVEQQDITALELSNEHNV